MLDKKKLDHLKTVTAADERDGYNITVTITESLPVLTYMKTPMYNVITLNNIYCISMLLHLAYIFV